MSKLYHAIGRALRETGQAMDRAGLYILNKPLYKEPFSRHRTKLNLFKQHPWTGEDVFVAPCATLVGSVSVHAKSAVMYGAVVRGDQGTVDIGAYTTVQDRAVIKGSTHHGEEVGVSVGDFVVVGAGAVLDSCTVGSRAKIGAGAVVQDHAVVEELAEVAPGAVVASGTHVPKGQLWAGNPAVFSRNLTAEEVSKLEIGAADEAAYSRDHAVHH